MLAGAGTGKDPRPDGTLLLLVDLLGIDPARYRPTFTNKAAAEMKTRIRRRLGDVDMQYVCTFHCGARACCARTYTCSTTPRSISLLDEEDRKEVLQKVLSTSASPLKELPIRRAVSRASAST